jgi:tetratricopeptide (TPR) repeat protein
MMLSLPILALLISFADNPTLSPACLDLNQKALSRLEAGFADEALTSLANRRGTLGDSCEWMILHNMAVAMSRTGRLREAETLARRSLELLESSRASNDRMLLRPLGLLGSIQFELHRYAAAHESLRRMQMIDLNRPEDRALVHAAAAALLQAEGSNRAAEREFKEALAACEEAGSRLNADAASALEMLGTLYLTENRLDEADRTLDRAQAILEGLKVVTPLDRTTLLSIRAAVHGRQGKWKDAEEELRVASATADQNRVLSSGLRKALLMSYAQALRKNRKESEARQMEARAATFNSPVVDVSEFANTARPAKR